MSKYFNWVLSLCTISFVAMLLFNAFQKEQNITPLVVAMPIIVLFVFCLGIAFGIAVNMDILDKGVKDIANKSEAKQLAKRADVRNILGKDFDVVGVAKFSMSELGKIRDNHIFDNLIRPYGFNSFSDLVTAFNRDSNAVMCIADDEELDNLHKACLRSGTLSGASLAVAIQKWKDRRNA